MSPTLPLVHLARHGETAWSRSGQHTGHTDIPLTEQGEAEALRLGRRLEGMKFDRIFTSPLQRAKKTCHLAGFSDADIDPDLMEWNYGEYEGKTTAQIRQSRPDWQLFRDGCPQGESVVEVAARADRVIARLRKIGGDVLIFSSGHFLRVLGPRWCGLDGSSGRFFYLGTASFSALGYEHTTDQPVIRLWNDLGHLAV